jgi:hypothetical protein
VESEIAGKSSTRRRLILAIFVGVVMLTPIARAQEKTPVPSTESPDISLRKSVNVKRFEGKDVQGEERQIGRGDSLWRILVDEKGLNGKQFSSYVVVIRGLNPQVKNLDVLRIGDKIFIPLRPEELVGVRQVTDNGTADRGQIAKGEINNYRVKSGEHLYQILREQLMLTDERKVAQYYELVKDLNPERKNWETLLEGEVIRLPVAGRSYETAKNPLPPVAQAKTAANGRSASESATAPATKPAAETKPITDVKPTVVATPSARLDPRQVVRAPAKENFALFAQVAAAMGGEMQQSGEEVIAMRDGAVRFDKKNYPVVFSPALGQRVVIDPEGNIPASLRTKLGDPNVGAAIVPLAKGTIQEAVGQLLAGLGYQALPGDRPVVIQEDGVAYEAKGNWLALAPEENNKPQQVFVISLTESSGEIPDYLKAQLAKKGLQLKDIVLPQSGPANTTAAKSDAKELLAPAKTWPRDKREIVDSLLLAYGISFGVGETLSVQLQNGLRIDALTDRVFDLAGKRTALFFQRPDVDVIKNLQEKEGVRTEELDLSALSSREVIGRLLTILGEKVTYREHRFAAAKGAAQDRLTVAAWGFNVPNHSLFITDRQIPVALHRFFFEKGLEIVYFQ